MHRYMPLDVFLEVDDPVFVTDEEGRIEFCNQGAASLFGRTVQGMVGCRCWQVTGIRSQDGKMICRERCAPQRLAREGVLPESIPVVVTGAGETALPMDLFAFPVSPPFSGRLAMLHLLKPAHAAEHEPEAAQTVVESTELLRHLSPRETEVLRHLANGLSTEAVASEMCLSPATVRNHIRSILSKLRVHHRIEAILAWIVRAQGERV